MIKSNPNSVAGRVTVSGIGDQREPGVNGSRISRHALVALRGSARRLTLQPHSRPRASSAGGYLSHFRGRGMEFDETRIYQPGDEVRHMDWRVTARSGQPHVKMFREERERPVWVWVDQGPGMQFGTRCAWKSVRAAEAATLLAWAAVDGGDRLGAMVFAGERHRELPPRARHAGALQLIETLSKPHSLRAAAPSARAATGMAAGVPTPATRRTPLDRLAQLVRPGSLVFLLGDFADLDHQQEVLLARLAAHSELVLGLVYDPLEAEPPPAGRYPVSDGRRFSLLDSRSRQQALAHQRNFDHHWQRLQVIARRHRMRSLQLSTAEPALAQLLAGL
jgi:uncharacterized protein (DUF58 family)